MPGGKEQVSRRFVLKRLGQTAGVVVGGGSLMALSEACASLTGSTPPKSCRRLDPNNFLCYDGSTVHLDKNHGGYDIQIQTPSFNPGKSFPISSFNHVPKTGTVGTRLWNGYEIDVSTKDGKLVDVSEFTP